MDRAVGPDPAVAGVEHQVEDVQDGRQPHRQILLGRQQRGADPPQPLLGPEHPLPHRPLADQERVRDLGRRQAGQAGQAERDLRLDRQRRVRAGEHHLQPVVGDELGLRHQVRRLAGRLPGDQPELLRLHQRAPGPVHGPVAGRGHQPRHRLAGHAVDRPPDQGAREGVLNTILGEFPVPGQPGQGHRDVIPGVSGDGRELLRYGLVAVRHGPLGRDASSITSSSCSPSMMSKPHICPYVRA